MLHERRVNDAGGRDHGSKADDSKNQEAHDPIQGKGKPGIVSPQTLHDGKHEIPNAQSEHYVGPEMCGYLQYGQDAEDGDGSEHQDLLLLEEVPNGTPSHLVERHCGL
jgi:hypothetical protein